MPPFDRADPHTHHPGLTKYVEAGAVVVRVLSVETLDAYPQLLLALSDVPQVGDIINIEETSVAPALKGEIVSVQSAEFYMSRAQDAENQVKAKIHDVVLRPAA